MQVFLSALTITVITLGVGRCLFETLKVIASQSWSVAFDWLNKLILYSMSIAFVSPLTCCHCVNSLQWQLGVLALFLGWINLLNYAAKFPLAGIYVIMLARVFYTFLKVVLLASFLVIAFGLAFHMALFDPEKVNTEKLVSYSV